MAREPIRTAADPVFAALAPSRAPGQLWQVPLFLAGVGALLGVWWGRPLWRGTELQRFERDLSVIRRALSESPPDTARALEFAEALLEKSTNFPERTGEFHFLYGTACLRRSQELPASLAKEYRQQARAHFEQADALGVPPADQAKLDYRLAVVWSATGEDPRQIIPRLESALGQGADDPFEGYGLLAQAHLHVPAPNFAAALEASKKQLASPTAHDALLAPARLLQGELLLQLRQPEAARQILARIGPDAPPDLLARVRHLHAESCQGLGRWAEAAALWEASLADVAYPPSNPSRDRYYLGVCYARMQKISEANRTWETVLPRAGEEGQAAAFALAETHLLANGAADAVRFFERGLRNVNSPAEYANSLVGLPEVQRLFDQACRQYRERGDFEHARQLARLSERIASAAVAAEVRGLTEEAWAAERRQAKHDDEARKHALEAATAFALVTEAAPDQAARARWLRRSADRFMDAQDRAQAIIALRKLIRTEPAPERVAEAWFVLAQVYEGLPNEPLAVEAYRKCIELPPGPFAFRARYRLAEIEIAHGKLDDAEKTLMQILQIMQGSADDTVYEKTLVTLADLLYQRGNYRMAKAYYQETLDRNPAREGNTRARFRLADCFYRLAIQESKNTGVLVAPGIRMQYQERYHQWLSSAAETFQKLSRDLAARRADDPLPADEEAILRQADFCQVECWIMLGQYDEAIHFCETLTSRYYHRFEHLRALRDMWRCYSIKRESEKATKTLRDMRDLLNELDQKGFKDYPATEPRNYWHDWMQEHGFP